MKLLHTDIHIEAPAHTIWAILDDLDRFPEWNRVLPKLAGRTTLGQTLNAEIAITDEMVFPFTPTLTRLVPARELRWVSHTGEGEHAFSAEHIFQLRPEAGGTLLIHQEAFHGPVPDGVWEMSNTITRARYEEMNHHLKDRAESFWRENATIHPALGQTSAPWAHNERRQLTCRCADDPVCLDIPDRPNHNHLCGCSQCYKPPGALMAQIATIPAGSATITAGENKLAPINPNASIQRHACTKCGTHVIGRVSNPDHPFYGMDFIHPELAGNGLPIEFAGFVSSLIPTITPPHTAAIRRQLHSHAIPTHDGFSPEIEDCIAWHRTKLAGAGGGG